MINTSPSYSYLLRWENELHKSADDTLSKVLKDCKDTKSWTDNANFIITKLGENYLGYKNYSKSSEVDKIKASLQAFSSVFGDTLEHNLRSIEIPNPSFLEFEINNTEPNLHYKVNYKLLISSNKDSLTYSGTVSSDENPRNENLFTGILNNCINNYSIELKIKNDTPGITKTKLSQEASKIRQKIRENWRKIYVVVTPLCDVVQSKNFNNRVVKGFLLQDSEELKYLDEKSEAIFISPKFEYDDKIYRIVLNFRYFFTAMNPEKIKFVTPIFRIRQQLLAEIQSKLSRHINRQGVLFLDDR